MLSILPTAHYFDRLITATGRWTAPGISTIAPGSITPASKLWLDFSYQPTAYILGAIERLERAAEAAPTIQSVPDVPRATDDTPTVPAPSNADTDTSVPPVHSWVKTYRAHKAQHPDAIVFLHIDDFFQTFDEDAKTVAAELQLFLGGKGEGQNRAPMTGVRADDFPSFKALLRQESYTVRVITLDLPNDEADKKIQDFEILAGSTPIAVCYNPRWLNSTDAVHFEFRSKEAPRQPIPCSDSGYHSHFTTPQAVAEYESPIAYAKAYVESHRSKPSGRKHAAPKDSPSPEQQIALTLNTDASRQLPRVEPEGLRRLVPLAIGDVVEVADTLHPKHANHDAVGNWGRVVKFTDADKTHATIELIDSGKRCGNMPTVCLKRLERPELQTLGTSGTLKYATLNGELHAWVGFKTKALYSNWCCRKRDRSAHIKDLEAPKRSLYTDAKWECAIIKPTMKKLKKLAAYDFSQEPGTFFFKQRQAQEAQQAKPKQQEQHVTPARAVLSPGTLIEVTTEQDNLSGRLANVLSDYLKTKGEDVVVARIHKGKVAHFKTGEFRVVNTKPPVKVPQLAA